MFRAVLLWKPSVPELPEVPAAVNADPEYMIPYAARKTVLDVIW